MLPRISPVLSRAIEIPLASFSTNTLSKICGFASPVAKTPSRLDLVKVQLAMVGAVDSIQTAVPRLAGLVTVTPRYWASSARTIVIF